MVAAMVAAMVAILSSKDMVLLKHNMDTIKGRL